MSDFAAADFVQRRRMIEDALAEVLRPIGEIGNDHEMGRCLVVMVRRCENARDFERFALWDLATALEAKLA